MGYKVQIEFPVPFGDGDVARCIALQPPERLDLSVDKLPWTVGEVIYTDGEKWDGTPDFQATFSGVREQIQKYHMPPEIFVSDGTPGSIVANWVASHNGGIGGLHHIAYQVESVEDIMNEWKEKGYAEFTSEEPFKCPDEGLTQVFTKPSELCGVIFEFIKREEYGFCAGNVKSLMISTANLDSNMR